MAREAAQPLRREGDMAGEFQGDLQPVEGRLAVDNAGDAGLSRQRHQPRGAGGPARVAECRVGTCGCLRGQRRRRRSKALAAEVDDEPLTGRVDQHARQRAQAPRRAAAQAAVHALGFQRGDDGRGGGILAEPGTKPREAAQSRHGDRCRCGTPACDRCIGLGPVFLRGARHRRHAEHMVQRGDPEGEYACAV
jgi:hypothetical protein